MAFRARQAVVRGGEVGYGVEKHTRRFFVVVRLKLKEVRTQSFVEIALSHVVGRPKLCPDAQLCQVSYM